MLFQQRRSLLAVSCSPSCSASIAQQISSRWSSLSIYPPTYKESRSIAVLSSSFTTPVVLQSALPESVTSFWRCSAFDWALNGIFFHISSKRTWTSLLLLHWRSVQISEHGHASGFSALLTFACRHNLVDPSNVINCRCHTLHFPQNSVSNPTTLYFGFLKA